MADQIKAEDGAVTATAKVEAGASELSQNPLKQELAKEQGRRSRTEKEKAEFSLKKNAERLKELGGDPTDILGVKTAEEEMDDEVPEWYRKQKTKEAQKTALDMAGEITDPDEKNLAIEYLNNRIRPSGNAQDDFKLALSAVHALKNKQIIEEISRRTNPTRTASGGTISAQSSEIFEPTPEEAIMMKPPYKLSKEKIIAARLREQEKQK